MRRAVLQFSLFLFSKEHVVVVLPIVRLLCQSLDFHYSSAPDIPPSIVCLFVPSDTSTLTSNKLILDNMGHCVSLFPL